MSVIVPFMVIDVPNSVTDVWCGYGHGCWSFADCVDLCIIVVPVDHNAVCCCEGHWVCPSGHVPYGFACGCVKSVYAFAFVEWCICRVFVCADIDFSVSDKSNHLYEVRDFHLRQMDRYFSRVDCRQLSCMQKLLQCILQCIACRMPSLFVSVRLGLAM